MNDKLIEFIESKKVKITVIGIIWIGMVGFITSFFDKENLFNIFTKSIDWVGRIILTYIVTQGGIDVANKIKTNKNENYQEYEEGSNNTNIVNDSKSDNEKTNNVTNKVGYTINDNKQ